MRDERNDGDNEIEELGAVSAFDLYSSQITPTTVSVAGGLWILPRIEDTVFYSIDEDDRVFVFVSLQLFNIVE